MAVFGSRFVESGRDYSFNEDVKYRVDTADAALLRALKIQEDPTTKTLCAK
jgi:hypothetical protein